MFAKSELLLTAHAPAQGETMDDVSQPELLTWEQWPRLLKEKLIN